MTMLVRRLDFFLPFLPKPVSIEGIKGAGIKKKMLLHSDSVSVSNMTPLQNTSRHLAIMPRFPLFLICVFAIACLPRLLSLESHWSSDERKWLRRGETFIASVKRGDFSKTLVTHHPGVTTMWLAGLRQYLKKTYTWVSVRDLALARWFIGVVVWTGIGAACLLIYRLLGQWVALASFACLAYSPLFLAQTRRVHTDALATTFILLTVLLFLRYCQNRQRHRTLVFSGITYGLALLSKSYALILLPWLPICLFLFRETHTGGARAYFAEGICFLSCTALTVLLLWPVFWTPIFTVMAICLLGLTFVLFRKREKPPCPRWLLGIAFAGLCLVGVRAVQTLLSIFDGVTWAVTTPHEVEHFFLGKVVNDPGWLFYPFVLTIKSTPLMLPLSLIGCILLWRHRKHTETTTRHFKTGIALIAGVVIFTVCLSATSKKFSRYLLPAFPLLEILAAIGFVEGLKWCYARLVSRFGTQATATYKITLAVIACVGFFVIQVFPVLALHPYYGTYYNLCWKGTDLTKIITVGEASGLDIAANYLNQKPNAHRMRVQVSPLATEFVHYYFRGVAYRSDTKKGHTPDYEVVYIRDSQIGRVPQTGTLNGDLEAVISLNGIDHVWIYQVTGHPQD